MASFLASLRQILAAVSSRLRRCLTQPRGRVGRIIAAILLLSLCVGLLALNQRAPQQDDPLVANGQTRSLAATATLDATATNTLAPTNTPKPRPTTKPVVAPKPPPIPTKPPQPTATTVPAGSPPPQRRPAARTPTLVIIRARRRYAPRCRAPPAPMACR